MIDEHRDAMTPPIAIENPPTDRPKEQSSPARLSAAAPFASNTGIIMRSSLHIRDQLEQPDAIDARTQGQLDQQSTCEAQARASENLPMSVSG